MTIDPPIEPELAIVRMTHQGQSNFIVEAVDGSGERVAGLMNEIGDYSGRQLLARDDPSTFAGLAVDADGPWEIEFLPPTPETVTVYDGSGPVNGNGDDVIGTELGDLTSASLDYQGDRNFAITTLNLDTGQVDLLVNEIGPWSGSVFAPSGVTLWGVTAHPGDWSITFG